LNHLCKEGSCPIRLRHPKRWVETLDLEITSM
jgi:hypothetical protein